MFKVGGFIYNTQKEFLVIFAIRILSLKLTFICIGGNRQSYNQELQSRVTNKVTVQITIKEKKTKFLYNIDNIDIDIDFTYQVAF